MIVCYRSLPTHKDYNCPDCFEIMLLLVHVLIINVFPPFGLVVILNFITRSHKLRLPEQMC